MVAVSSCPSGKFKLRRRANVELSSCVAPCPKEDVPMLVDRDRESKGTCELSVSLVVLVTEDDEVLDLRRNGRVTRDDILPIPKPPRVEVGLVVVCIGDAAGISCV
jgi:hypothetical protein